MVLAWTRARSRSTSTIDVVLVQHPLSEVTDPKTGLSIGNLGRIQLIGIDRRSIRARITMASPGSPMSGMLADEVGVRHGARSLPNRLIILLMPGGLGGVRAAEQFGKPPVVATAAAIVP
jgi:hypothetical protein